MARLKTVCRECGSEDVTIHATVKWNVEAQRWDHFESLGFSDCNHCDAEQCLGMVEIPDGDDSGPDKPFEPPIIPTGIIK